MTRIPTRACALGITLLAASTLSLAPDAAAAPPPTAGPEVPSEQVLPAAPDMPDSAADAGDLAVVTGANSNDALSEGDSNAVFSVRLPEGSTCPGDSANDDWRVQTFVVPAANDLGTLRYGGTRPQGDFMYALYTTEGRPFTQVFLAQNPGPGLPGQILPMPAMSFTPFTPDLLPVGRYKIGVACTFLGVGERYWDAEIEFTEDLDVEPGQRRWRLVGAAAEAAAAADDDGGGSNTLVIVAIAGLAVAAFVALFAVRKQRTPPLIKEHAR